jgi:GNAT superfamily N-acetyltransferase
LARTAGPGARRVEPTAVCDSSDAGSWLREDIAIARAADASITVRPASAREFRIVWTLLMGLAVYERRRRQVEATPARLRRHGSGRRPYFRALICRRGPTPVGVAIYLMTYSTFAGRPTLYIEDIFVLPRERGHGAGQAMMRALARIAVRTGCGRMAWSVLRWNTPAIRFYRRLGAHKVSAWASMGLGTDEIRRLAASAFRRSRSGRRSPVRGEARAGRPRRRGGRARSFARG